MKSQNEQRENPYKKVNVAGAGGMNPIGWYKDARGREVTVYDSDIPIPPRKTYEPTPARKPELDKAALEEARRDADAIRNFKL